MYLSDIVEALAGVVADAGLGVVKTMEDGREEQVQVVLREGGREGGRGG